MAQQDKTDWYWNGVLAGAVNNLYYDLINVDVCHVPYATNHRNSSFFLKTRPGYCISDAWYNGTDTEGYEVTDLKIIWNENCKDESGVAYAVGKKGNKKAIFACPIEKGCAKSFFNCSEYCQSDSSSDVYDVCPDMENEGDCGDWKLFTMNYVKGSRYDGDSIIKPIGNSTITNPGILTGVQMNKYTLGTTVGLFSDKYVEDREGEFKGEILRPGNYILIWDSANDSESGFAGQVRMITGTESSDGVTRVTVDAPWSGFKVADSSQFSEGEEKIQKGGQVSYAVFQERGEVVGFVDSNKIYFLPWSDDCKATRIYIQNGTVDTKIIGVAEANDKIFILTDNGYVHYSSNNGVGGYDKFFIQDDMFAGTDKSSIVAYRDMVLAFGRRHIAIGVPDEQNNFWTMYNQSTTIGLWSRYSYTEYEGDLIFVSNDKRLLALSVNSAGRYGLTFEDVGDRLNGKLSSLIPGDEVFLGSYDNDLRVFVQTKPNPYTAREFPRKGSADINTSGSNTITHIYKFDTLFKVRSEDHILFLLRGASGGVFYGEGGVYVRRYSEAISNNKGYDIQGGNTRVYHPYKSIINAYLIENESDWIGGTSSRLANRPKLYNTAKINRLITTLGPGVYSSNSKIKITTYSKGIGYTYEFPINGDGNDWVGLMTSYYLNERLDDEEEGKIECMLSTLQDSQKQYQPSCPDGKVYRQYMAQTTPWCDSYTELLTESHGVCINDKLYELAPTMPLVTNLGENQDYATQIKLELIGGEGDIICFGGWLAEMFVAPLFTTGPDGEYQLQPNTDCE